MQIYRPIYQRFIVNNLYWYDENSRLAVKLL